MNEHQRRDAGATGDAVNREGRFEGRDRSPEEIEREIEATRERMSHNIDALGEKPRRFQNEIVRVAARERRCRPADIQ